MQLGRTSLSPERHRSTSACTVASLATTSLAVPPPLPKYLDYREAMEKYINDSLAAGIIVLLLLLWGRTSWIKMIRHWSQ